MDEASAVHRRTDAIANHDGQPTTVAGDSDETIVLTDTTETEAAQPACIRRSMAFDPRRAAKRHLSQMPLSPAVIDVMP